MEIVSGSSDAVALTKISNKWLLVDHFFESPCPCDRVREAFDIGFLASRQGLLALGSLIW